MKKIFSAVIASLFIFSGSAVSAQAVTYSATQERAIKALFASFASSQPATIEKAVNARTAANSDARLFGNVVKNHFSSRQYLKAIDTSGNISPTMQDPRGRYNYKNGRVNLNSYFDFFDGIYSDFKFDKSGKITSFSKRDAKGATKRSLSNSIFDVTVNFSNSGMKINSGAVLINSQGRVFTQLRLEQEFGGLISWTERGNYRSPDGTVHVVDNYELGCMTDKGVAYYESLSQTPAVVAAGTTAVATIPFQTECAKRGNDRPANVLIKTN
jgi:hypothetical protein